jgi:hypothetical protein
VISLAVLVPVLVALLVVVRITGDRSDGSGAVAEVSGTTAPAPGENMPVLPVDTTTPSAQADASCPALVQELPLMIAEEEARKVRSTSPYVRAWGNPPVVLICGVDRPSRFVVGASLILINGVQWFVDTSDPKTVVWTAVDRPVYVQVRVPASTDSASVTELTTHITATLPQQAPTPGS